MRRRVGVEDENQAVVAWGAMPPPIHGSAVVNQQVLAILQSTETSITWINPAKASAITNIQQFSFRKVARGVWELGRFASTSVRRFRRHTGYISPALLGWAFYRDLFPWMVSTFCAERTIVHVHTTAFEGFRRRGLVGLLCKWAMDRAEVWVLADAFVPDMRRIGPRTIEVVKNGTACLAHGHTGPYLNEDRSAPLQVVFLGNHFQLKGVDTAIKVVDELRDLPITWVFAGSAVEEVMEAGLQSLIGAGVDLTRIEYIDVESKCSLLRAADCLLMPSHLTEAAPLVVLEAMAHGAVPLVTAQGGMPEMVGDAGIVCEGQEDFVSSLRRLGIRRDEVEDRARRSLDRWKREYSSEIFDARVRQLLVTDPTELARTV